MLRDHSHHSLKVWQLVRRELIGGAGVDAKVDVDVSTKVGLEVCLRGMEHLDSELDEHRYNTLVSSRAGVTEHAIRGEEDVF